MGGRAGEREEKAREEDEVLGVVVEREGRKEREE